MSASMWALRQPGPGQFETLRVPIPVLESPGQVLVRFEVGGICGSDIPAFLGRRNVEFSHTGRIGAPLHEIVGTVVESRSSRFDAGDRVVGTAWPAGLLEYVVVDESSIAPVHAALTSIQAIVAQPLATVLCALERLGILEPTSAVVDGDRPGDRQPFTRASVLGLGPMGLLFAHVLADRGIRVTGIDRVSRAQTDDVADGSPFGLSESYTGEAEDWAHTIDAEYPWDDPQRPDLIIDAIGHDDSVLASAVTAARSFGTIYSFGLPEEHYVLPMRVFFRKTLTLRAGATDTWSRHLNDAQAYLNRHRSLAADYVTHEYSTDNAERAFRRYALPHPGQRKIILVTV